MRGVVRPSDLTGDDVSLRIADAQALLGAQHVLGGWASLNLQGNSWFDGLVRPGTPKDVLIHCLAGAQLRRRSGIRPSQGLVHDEEIIEFNGGRITTLARAAVDEMRTAPSLRAAVIVFDMATSSTAQVAHTSRDRIARVMAMHRKTRGITQAVRASQLGSTRSASPLETSVRLAARMDVGLTDLHVNRPVFDEYGQLLGVADLLDADAGLVIEADGSGHRDEHKHASDNIREELFERAGLIVCRISAIDLHDRAQVTARIAAARRDAMRSPRGAWTLDQPDWWHHWPPARRWD